ncbi:MAG: EamA family transporter, partial [Deltaproteobacteria bacterium]
MGPLGDSNLLAYHTLSTSPPSTVISQGSVSHHYRHRGHHFFAMALIANVATYYFFVKGTQFLTSGVAGVLSGTIPLMTALLVVLTLPTEKLTRRKTVGLALGLIGVVFVSHFESSFSATRGNELIGAGFILLGSFCIALGIVYVNKYITPLKMSALHLAAYQT